MTLKKKIILGFLIFVTVASAAASVFFPPLASLTGLAITGIIGMGVKEVKEKRQVATAKDEKPLPETVKNSPSLESLCRSLETTKNLPNSPNLHFSYHAKHTEKNGVITDEVDVELHEESPESISGIEMKNRVDKRCNL